MSALQSDVTWKKCFFCFLKR